MKIAVIGAGIAGLGCAHALTRDASSSCAVTLFESASRLGGHTNTVDVTLDGVTYPVDTGFLVFNERTYPQLIGLFDELKIPIASSDMSFSVSVAEHGRARRLEWAGTSLASVFAQHRNLVSPRFIGMLADLLRFNAQATRIADGKDDATGLTLSEFLDRYRYGEEFRQWYLLPMAAAIWSCPMATMLAYPVATFVRFCHNHGLLQISDRPRWFTVQGGARQYVERIAARLADVRIGDPVQKISRSPSGKAIVSSLRSRETFDHVVLACHSDQALRMLIDADRDERDVLAAIRYQPNRAVLHTDQRLLPQSRKVWAAWNYLSDGVSLEGSRSGVSVTYLLNKLQPLPFATPVLVSLNPLTEPCAESVIAEFDYAHPIFDEGAVAAQNRLARVQGRRGVWFAGAWTGYGFHEDGLKSGLAVAAELRERAAAALPMAA